MEKLITPQVKAAVASYLRSALAAAAALYLSGVTDWRLLLNAAIAAVIGPVIRALNPRDAVFGLVAKDLLEKALVEPTKKSAAKKPAKK